MKQSKKLSYCYDCVSIHCPVCVDSDCIIMRNDIQICWYAKYVRTDI